LVEIGSDQIETALNHDKCAYISFYDIFSLNLRKGDIKGTLYSSETGILPISDGKF